jgi:hypothetical protein
VARTKTPAAAARVKHSLSERLAALRAELFGDRGGPELARRLGLPIRTWYNYEAGVTVPGEAMLKLIELTSVEPLWLLHGRGPKYRTGSHVSAFADAVAPDTSVTGLIRTALQLLESGVPAGLGTECDVEWLQVRGNAMAPIIADGAYVAFAKQDEPPEDLDGKLVMALIDGQRVVRWFRHHGRFARLCAEKTDSASPEAIIDLTKQAKDQGLRRVVRICTPCP